METVRIGKDITFIWEVRKDGSALASGDAAYMSVEIAARNGNAQKLPFEIVDGKIVAVWYGVKQTEVGSYRLTAWYNRGRVEESVVDVVWAVTLSRYTNEETYDDIDTVTIELDGGNLTFGVLHGASAYETAVAHGYVGTEEEWLDSLKEPAEEAADRANEATARASAAAELAWQKAGEAATAAAGAGNVDAELDGTILTVTNREGVSTSVNTKGEPGEVTQAELNAALALKEDVANKVTSIGSGSTDTQYPSAKAVNTALNSKLDKESVVAEQVPIEGTGAIVWSALAPNTTALGPALLAEAAYETQVISQPRWLKAGTEVIMQGTTGRYLVKVLSGDDLSVGQACWIVSDFDTAASDYCVVPEDGYYCVGLKSAIDANYITFSRTLNAINTIEGLEEEVARQGTAKADKAALPNDVTRSQTDATFVHSESGVLTALFYLRQATSFLAGLMTAADKRKLDGVDAQFATKADKAVVDAIQALIPGQASAQNQLADKNFVNSSIGTNTANYISDNGQPFTSLASLEAYSGTLTNNDYAFVVGTDAAGNTTYTRYKYNAGSQEWAEEYVLNNSSFTAAQWASIQSGIVSDDVLKLRDLPFAAALPVSGRLSALGFELLNPSGSVLFTIPFADSTGGGLITLEDLTRFIDLGTKQELDAKFAGKVDKITGKGLSTEDFTSELKQKLTDLPLTKGTGNKSVMTLGAGNSATHLSAIALGNSNSAKQEYAICLGEYNTSIGWDTFAVGSRNTVQRHMAMAIGRYNVARAWGSIAMGLGVETFDNQTDDNNNGEIAIGRYNTPAKDRIFTIGCGTSDNDRKNAVVVDANGMVSFPQENTSVTDLLTQIESLRQRIATLEGNV